MKLFLNFGSSIKKLKTDETLSMLYSSCFCSETLSNDLCFSSNHPEIV